MIEILNVLQEIKTEKLRDFTQQNGVVCFSGIGVGVFASKGKKKFMEDSHKIFSCLQDQKSKKAFFGMYDGHGGKRAAHIVVICSVLLWMVCWKSRDGGGEVRRSKDGVVWGVGAGNRVRRRIKGEVQ
ncbi:hypothetical protein FF2_006372 [Malus domestica]